MDIRIISAIFLNVWMILVFVYYFLYSKYCFRKSAWLLKNKGVEASQEYVRPIVSAFCRRSFTLFGMKPEIRHKERQPENGAFIIVGNHQSFFDVPLLLGFVNPWAFVIAKKEFEKTIFFGKAIRQVGYFIDRSDPRQATGVIRKTLESLKNGKVLGFFPEGTRSPDGNIQPFQKNSLKIAMIAKVPIVPMVICGTREAMPKGSLFIKKSQVTVELLDPIAVEGFTDEPSLSVYLHTIMTKKKKEMEDEKGNH